jgi:hypothetical protein
VYKDERAVVEVSGRESFHHGHNIGMRYPLPSLNAFQKRVFRLLIGEAKSFNTPQAVPIPVLSGVRFVRPANVSKVTGSVPNFGIQRHERVIMSCGR